MTDGRAGEGGKEKGGIQRSRKWKDVKEEDKREGGRKKKVRKWDMEKIGKNERKTGRSKGEREGRKRHGSNSATEQDIKNKNERKMERKKGKQKTPSA